VPSPDPPNGPAAQANPVVADGSTDAPVDGAVAADGAAPVEAGAETEVESGFRVALSNFEGPFDLLLTLIARRELDITEVSLGRVTDDFIAFLDEAGLDEHLDEASEFIVIAATLLDMKIVSLLPQGDYVDAEDVAVLEARDLLFARLLQYRAFKEVSTWFAERLGLESSRHVREVALEPRFREWVPPLQWSLSLTEFAALATVALTPRLPEVPRLDHLHAPRVSIREQAAVLVARLRDERPHSFDDLVADAGERAVVVARFLALLELFRRAAISFDQPVPLGVLTVVWTAESWSDDDLETLGSDFDR